MRLNIRKKKSGLNHYTDPDLYNQLNRDDLLNLDFYEEKTIHNNLTEAKTAKGLTYYISTDIYKQLSGDSLICTETMIECAKDMSILYSFVNALICLFFTQNSYIIFAMVCFSFWLGYQSSLNIKWLFNDYVRNAVFFFSFLKKHHVDFFIFFCISFFIFDNLQILIAYYLSIWTADNLVLDVAETWKKGNNKSRTRLDLNNDIALFFIKYSSD